MLTLKQLQAIYKEVFGHEAPESINKEALMQLCAPHFGVKEGGGESVITVTEKELAETIAKTVGKKVEEIKSEMEANEKELRRQLLEQREAGSKEAPLETKKKVGKFFKALCAGDEAKVKDLSEGTDSEGGYLVHDEFMKKVIYILSEFGIARKSCLVIPMGSDTKNVSALAGSVSAYWTDEGAAISASQPSFGKKVLTAKKLAGISVGTNELIEDAEDADVFDLVAELFANAFAEKEDTEVLAGTGTVFTGVINLSGANIVTMDATNTAFSDLTSDNLIAMQYAVDEKYLKRKPKYYFSRTILQHIHGLKDSNGQYIHATAKAGLDATIHGQEYETASCLPALSASAANTKFIVFGDLRFVAFGDRKSVTTKLMTEGTVGSINLGEEDKQALRVVERVAVVALIDEAFSVLKTAAA